MTHVIFAIIHAYQFSFIKFNGSDNCWESMANKYINEQPVDELGE